MKADQRGNSEIPPDVELLIAGSLVEQSVPLLQLIARKVFGGGVEVNCQRCETLPELKQLLSQQRFNLAILHLYRLSGPAFEELQSRGQVADWLHRPEGEPPRYIANEGRAMIGYLAKGLGLPTIVVNSCSLDHEVILQCGALVSLDMPWKLEQLEVALLRCLRSHQYPGQ